MFCMKMKNGNQMSGVLKNIKSFVRRCLGLTARSSLFLAEPMAPSVKQLQRKREEFDRNETAEK